jgi:molecular chaperone DnaJ
MENKDFYEVLGVSREAAPEMARLINEAYDTLSDPEKRQQYDSPPQPTGGFFNSANFHLPPDFLNFFQNPWMGQQQRPFKNSDIGLTAKIPVEMLFGNDMFTEIEYKVAVLCEECLGAGYLSAENCSECNGNGVVMQNITQGTYMMSQTFPCPKCSGNGKLITEGCGKCRNTGRTEQDQKLKVNIYEHLKRPVLHPQRGPKDFSADAPAGDLYLVIEPIISNNGFMDDNFNVVMRQQIDALYFATESEIECNGLNNEKHKIQIKENVHQYPISGAGIPLASSRSALIYELSPMIQKITNEELKENIKKYLAGE